MIRHQAIRQTTDSSAISLSGVRSASLTAHRFLSCAASGSSVAPPFLLLYNRRCLKRPTRAGKNSQKVVKLCENSEPAFEQVRRARFVRRRPYETQRVAPNVALLLIRARYYQPLTGEFTSRDPLEYVDGMSLYRGYFVPNAVDPFGLCEPVGVTPEGKQIIKVSPECAKLMTGFEAGDCFIWDELAKTKTKTPCPGGAIRIPTDEYWSALCREKGYTRYLKGSWYTADSLEYSQYLRGCVGVTSCLLGREAFTAMADADCYSSLAAALQRQAEMKEECFCGDDSQPEVIGHTWRNGKTAQFDEACKLTGYEEGGGNLPGGTRYDFGFYRDSVFHHATDTLRDPNNCVLCSSPEAFHDYHDTAGWQTIYCVVCSGNDPTGR